MPVLIGLNLALAADPSWPPSFRDVREEFLSLYRRRAQHIYKTSEDDSWKVSRYRYPATILETMTHKILGFVERL